MIAIICVGNIELSPFIRKYTDVMDSRGIEYEIIHWNRYSDIKYAENVHTYYKNADRFGNKLKRVMPYFGFARFARRLIKKNKYDKLIILTTQTALILADKLLFKYKKRYFLDYRDASYEYIKPYSALVDKLCNAACAVAVSSRGFLELIHTAAPTYMAHNFQTASYLARDSVCKATERGKITLGYIGVLREYEYIRRLCDIFGGDERFSFVISGSGDCVEELRGYCAGYKNIAVTGAYKESEKADIIRSFDMICYNYPYSYVNYPAIANKFYDGMIYKKPMFGNIRTYSGSLINELGLGISLDESEENIPDKVYDYMMSFDRERFCQRSEAYLSDVMKDEREYIAAIEAFAEEA